MVAVVRGDGGPTGRSRDAVGIRAGVVGRSGAGIRRRGWYTNLKAMVGFGTLNGDSAAYRPRYQTLDGSRFRGVGLDAVGCGGNFYFAC